MPISVLNVSRNLVTSPMLKITSRESAEAPETAVIDQVESTSQRWIR